MPTAEDFRLTLRARMQEAEQDIQNHCRDQFWAASSPWFGGYPGQNHRMPDVLRRDEIRNDRRGCDPTGASEEAGRFAHDPLQASPLLMGTIMPKAPRC